MGKSSRQKRRTYQTPKRSRTNANLVWYVAAAVLVIGGSLAVALSRSNTSGIGPTASDHWHAALGVDDCGKWAPNWLTPVSQAGGPIRADNHLYAGMHSHGDGLIHMEPQSSADTGENATVGEYFKSAGFTIKTNEIKFGTLDPTTTVIEKNGNKCNGKPGVLRWAVNGKEHHGDPGKYKIFNGDVIAIFFTTADAKLPPKTDVPSYNYLQQQLGSPSNEGAPPGQTVPNATTTTPGAATTTAAPTTTSAPAGATSTTTP
jgi:hypothetical protein